jgi:hypothetical protein
MENNAERTMVRRGEDGIDGSVDKGQRDVPASGMSLFS